MQRIGYLFIFPIVILGIFLSVSCKKTEFDPNTAPSNDAQVDIMRSAKDNITAEMIFQDVIRQMEDVSYEEFNKVASNASVTVTPTTGWPRTITINYGVNTLSNIDGRYRTGIISAVFSAPLHDSGAVVTIAFNNYELNSLKITGNVTITNRNRNGNGQLIYGVQVTSAQIIKADAGVILWNADWTCSWIEGETTPSIYTDDIFSIEGTETGVNSQQKNYQVSIQSPLKLALSCKNIVSGSSILNSDLTASSIIIYGDGSCDAFAQVEYANSNYDIPLN